MAEWFEDESLWIETYPFTFSEQRFALAEEEVNKIIYSGQELKDRLNQVGFKRVKLFGDLDENEHGVNARRLVAAAWKGWASAMRSADVTSRRSRRSLLSSSVKETPSSSPSSRGTLST
jgi:hypothetical protein